MCTKYIFIFFCVRSSDCIISPMLQVSPVMKRCATINNLPTCANGTSNVQSHFLPNCTPYVMWLYFMDFLILYFLPYIDTVSCVYMSVCVICLEWKENLKTLYFPLNKKYLIFVNWHCKEFEHYRQCRGLNEYKLHGSFFLVRRVNDSQRLLMCSFFIPMQLLLLLRFPIFSVFFFFFSFVLFFLFASVKSHIPCWINMHMEKDAHSTSHK